MSDTQVTVAILAGGALLGALWIALSMRSERREAQERYEQIPLDDRIAAIRENIPRTVRWFEERLNESETLSVQAREWGTGMLAFCRRLDALAASPDASAEEIEALADEAGRFDAEHGGKGVIVVPQARELARLVRQRDAA